MVHPSIHITLSHTHTIFPLFSPLFFWGGGAALIPRKKSRLSTPHAGVTLPSRTHPSPQQQQQQLLISNESAPALHAIAATTPLPPDMRGMSHVVSVYVCGFVSVCLGSSFIHIRTLSLSLMHTHTLSPTHIHPHTYIHTHTLSEPANAHAESFLCRPTQYEETRLTYSSYIQVGEYMCVCVCGWVDAPRRHIYIQFGTERERERECSR
jgi:hypothetical protein